MKRISHSATLLWRGNNSNIGTLDFLHYSREYDIFIDNKAITDADTGDMLSNMPPAGATFSGTADPGFLGDPSLCNPKDFLLAAMASTHMLYYLALCSKHRLNVTRYEDNPVGTATINKDATGTYDGLTLHPQITITTTEAPENWDQIKEKALALHNTAHQQSLIIGAANFTITHKPEIVIKDAS